MKRSQKVIMVLNFTPCTRRHNKLRITAGLYCESELQLFCTHYPKCNFPFGGGINLPAFMFCEFSRPAAPTQWSVLS